LQKKYVLLIILFVNLLILYLLYQRYEAFLKKFYVEYRKLKEMQFLVNNKVQTSITLTEDGISSFLKAKGLDVSSVSTVENGIEVQLKQVNPLVLVDTIYELEKNGISVNNLKAVDNTGTGKMNVDMVLR
ncbi:MAG: hypothetical protein ACP5G3_07140, partial [Sulfurihydrogenibium sp.]|uniref:hypothetical protein n=1 Tax=Sulfurihydrogenibium sp. TaxID=2053621 RepID=UPI003D0B4A50